MNKRPNRIAELRKSMKISQEQLAETLNVTQASISLYENGNNIPTDILISLSRYFNVTIEYLLKVSDSRYDIPIENITASENSILTLYRNLLPKHRELADKLVEVINSFYTFL